MRAPHSAATHPQFMLCQHRTHPEVEVPVEQPVLGAAGAYHKQAYAARRQVQAVQVWRGGVPLVVAVGGRTEAGRNGRVLSVA
jgi:hypothetical protein